MSPVEYLISFVLIAAVALAYTLQRRDAVRQGQENPVGTAKVQQDVTGMGERLGRVESAVARIEKDLERAPTAADFERLRGDIKALSASSQGIKGHLESVDSAVVRIEMMLNNLAPSAPVRRRGK